MTKFLFISKTRIDYTDFFCSVKKTYFVRLGWRVIQSRRRPNLSWASIPFLKCFLKHPSLHAFLLVIHQFDPLLSRHRQYDVQ